MIKLFRNFLGLVQFAFTVLKSGMFLYVFKNIQSLPKEELEKFGAKVCVLLQELGPTFIKLGQFLSTRPDLIGSELAEHLNLLQDKLPPFPFKDVKKAFKKEFNEPIENLFKSFSTTPIAAASIAQVHKALTFEEQEVAVKVLRPNIEKRFARDIEVIKFGARLISLFNKHSKLLNLQEVIKTLEETIATEMDFRYEAAAADEIRENCKGDYGVKIPEIIWDLTSQRILTLEWVNAVPIHNKKQLLANKHDLHEIAKKLAITFFNQAYRDGFFHADLHPGNVLIDENGDVVLVDFGIIGTLNRKDRIFVAESLYGFIKQDYEKITNIHFEIGYVPKHKSKKLFKLACRSIGKHIVGLPVNEVSIGKVLSQLFDIGKNFEMKVQPQLMLLQKTLVSLEGLGYMLYPEVNMWELAEPWIKDWAKKNLGVNAKITDFKEKVLKSVKALPEMAVEITDIIKKVDDYLTAQEEKMRKK